MLEVFIMSFQLEPKRSSINISVHLERTGNAAPLHQLTETVFEKERRTSNDRLTNSIEQQRIVPETRDVFFFLSPLAKCVVSTEKCGA